MRRPRLLGRKSLRVGRFRVSSYAAMLYVGFVLGVALGLFACGLDAARFCAATLLLLVPALLGGRLWFLLGHPEIRSRSLDLQSGGAGLYGGLILSFVLSWPVLRLLGLPFWRFWDGAAVVLLTGMTVTRVGCLMTGCCSGRETRGPLGVWLPDQPARGCGDIPRSCWRWCGRPPFSRWDFGYTRRPITQGRCSSEQPRPTRSAGFGWSRCGPGCHRRPLDAVQSRLLGIAGNGRGDRIRCHGRLAGPVLPNLKWFSISPLESASP